MRGASFAVVVVAAIASYVWYSHRAPAAAPAPKVAAAGVALHPVAAARAIELPADPAAPAAPVAVTSDRVVARVDGAAITGRELVATPGSMSQPMYDALLERAIDRELILAKARHDGIALDAVHEHQLELVRARFTDDPAQAEWEVADAKAHMLLDALVGVSAVPAQRDVDAYYTAHREEFGDMPRVNADLEIRNTLSAEMTAKYKDAQRDYVDHLRAGATITH